LKRRESGQRVVSHFLFHFGGAGLPLPPFPPHTRCRHPAVLAGRATSPASAPGWWRRKGALLRGERGIDASGGDGDGAPLASLQPPRKRLCAPTARTLHPLQHTPSLPVQLFGRRAGVGDRSLARPSSESLTLTQFPLHATARLSPCPPRPTRRRPPRRRRPRRRRPRPRRRPSATGAAPAGGRRGRRGRGRGRGRARRAGARAPAPAPPPRPGGGGGPSGRPQACWTAAATGAAAATGGAAGRARMRTAAPRPPTRPPRPPAAPTYPHTRRRPCWPPPRTRATGPARPSSA